MNIRPLVNSAVTKILPNGEETTVYIKFGKFIAAKKVVRDVTESSYVDIYLEDGSIIPGVYIDCIEIYGGTIEDEDKVVGEIITLQEEETIDEYFVKEKLDGRGEEQPFDLG